MVTITRILCPVDFSEASQHAIKHALAIARWYKASISALHVYSPMFMPVPGRPDPGDRVPDVELTRVRAETTAWIATARAADDVGVDVLVEVGQPARHIIDLASSLPADVIVMGTHGASGFEHLVLGSVTEKVLRKARCPVLTVPPQAQAISKLPFRRLLCAVDFSDSSLSALELACSLTKESDAALTVLHVVEWPWQEPPPPVLKELPPDQATALAEFRRYLEKSATERLKALMPEAVRDRGATVRRVAHGKSYVEILRVAAEDSADLIVMGVHGRNAADLMLFGSTTNQVVRRATCPVLTVRH
jgi:nucleotide-binding universal stress UspA family protein